jgi:hypothetical protein
MHFRWAMLLLLVRIAFDAATPMLPGAILLTDGSLETDAGCYSRKGEDVAVAPTATHVPRRFAVLPPPKPTLRTERATYVSPPAPVRLRVPLKRNSIPAPAPVDD